jgi:TrmH family RNA methyltransferase
MNKYINSFQNPLIQHLIKLRKNKSYRLAHGSAIIQGKKNFYNICHHLQIKNLLLTKNLDSHAIHAENIVQVSHAVMNHVSGVETPDGIFAEVSISPPPALNTQGKTLILDRLQDPANMGALCRTAYALGWDRIILLTPCVDPFNDKVVRGSKAASLLVPIYQMTTEAMLNSFVDTPLFLADLGGEPYHKVLPPKNKRFGLILGQEAKGPSTLLQQNSQQILTIPISAKAESMNVAAAGSILMAHLNFCEAV